MSALQKTQEFFDRHAPLWDYHVRPEQQNRMQTILNEFAPELLNPLLDLGCGSGILHRVLPESLRLTEVDLSFQMLRRVKEKYAERKPKLIQADAHALPLRSGYYKTVICFQAFPHFNRPQQVMEEVNRILVSNGMWIILHLMDHTRLNALHRDAGQAVSEDILPAASELADRIREHSFSIAECREERALYLIAARKH